MTTPHFAAPFDFDVGGRAVVADQDSLLEVESCVSNVLNCFIGDCPDVPEFGIPNQLFTNVPLDISAVAQAIKVWEPRARTTITESASSDGSQRTVEVEVVK